MIYKVSSKYLAIVGAFAALSFLAPLTAKADLFVTTSGTFSPQDGDASWTFNGVSSQPGSNPDWGTFVYNSGNSNVVDFNLTVTPTINSVTETPLVFTGTITEDQFNSAYLSFSNGPLTSGPYSFNINTSGWLTACGARPCIQLNNGNVNKATELFGVVTTAAVPEPASAGIMLLAAFGLLAFGWKRKLFASKQ